MNSRRNIVKTRAGATIGALVLAVAAWGCTHAGTTEIRTSASLEEQDYSIVEVIEDPALRTKTILLIPENPYGDDGDCPCTCPTGCVATASELRALVAKLKLKATRRAEASAAAVLVAGDELLAYESWQDVVTSTMDLLSNPMIVIVRDAGGKLKKVHLEKLGTMDLSTTQIVSIKNKVSGKMQSAITANMIVHGIPEKNAKAYSKDIMQVYMSKMFAP